MTASAEKVRYSLKGCSSFQCLTDCASDNAASECAQIALVITRPRNVHTFIQTKNSEWALSTCAHIILF